MSTQARTCVGAQQHVLGASSTSMRMVAPWSQWHVIGTCASGAGILAQTPVPRLSEAA